MMPRHDASDRLGAHAEAVCRHYLSNGRRSGNYWQVGDVRNAPGRSMFVRLRDSPKGPPGKWTDAATGEHGDLLDVIRESLGLVDFRDVAEEARTFLAMPPTEAEPCQERSRDSAPNRIDGSVTATCRHVEAHHRYACGNVSARTRHYDLARYRSLALPSPQLLSARRLWTNRDVAGDDRFRHRPQRTPNRRAPHLAYTRRQRQGASRHAETRHG
jgi:hypothetical protein